MFRSITHRMARDAPGLPVEGHLPAFDGGTGWLNSEPLTPAGLRGRIVLVDFWTYTCINWLRTLPYVRAWEAKYRDHGLTVIGVHTPEFGFERNVDNVIARARDLRVGYPIALDSEYGIWGAFANQFWPAVYIADTEGRIRYHHFGEGEYEMSEMVIQQLLLDSGAEGIDGDLVSVEPQGFEVPADWRSVRTPETYLAYRRSAGFASPDDARLDQAHTYPDATRLGLNQWAPAGTWTITQQAAVLNQPKGRIVFRFQARDVNLIMGPATIGTSVPFHVLLDGQVPAAANGLDVDDQAHGTVTDQRLYQLIRQPGLIEERLFEIEFLEAGVETYCFTFG
jgi:thiol-disulfide isomerase/thioredoxin